MTQQWEALIVGIDEYPIYTTLHNLTVARKDGEDVTQKLRDYGYQSFRIQRLPQQPHQKGEEPNISRLGVKLDELKEKITNIFNPPSVSETPDLALFFFSGHGWRKIVDDKNDVFLATSDVYPKQEIYGISLSWLGEQIQKSPVKKVVVWLDCCFSGELIIKYLPTNKDYCFITATRSFETGLEINDEYYQQGLFTKTLLEGLNPDNYPDGIVDSHKLTGFIEKLMVTTSQRPLIANSERSILLTTKYKSQNFIDQCPYRSLSYFTENPEDAMVFYGRSELTQQLINRVKKDRFIAILGDSGSGKSSLLRAGLLYNLKLGQEIPGSNLWTFLTPFSPTDKPLKQLEDYGRGIIYYAPTELKNDPPLTPPSKGGGHEEEHEILTPSKEGGHEEEHEILTPSKGGGHEAKIAPFNTTEQEEKIVPLIKGGWGDQNPIIMIIDQFEECFTMCDETTRNTFFERLIELLDNYPSLKIIIGMRSDFRGRLREYENLVNKINKPYINVEHLNREEIEEAIIKPAETVGLLIEPALKEQLINDVEDYPGSLPLLQYTLTQLWQETRNQKERFLTLKTYKDLGKIEGTLDKRANTVFDSLDENEQEIAKRIFLELTQIGDTFDTRRRVYLHDLVNKHHCFEDLDRVTQKLANDKNRLVVRSEEDTGKLGDKETSVLLQNSPKETSIINNSQFIILIDVVHEALIRDWGMLRKWQDDYRNGMVIERKIEAYTKEWENNGKKPGDLLQGSKLDEAQEYTKNYGNLGMLDGLAEEFIEESKNLRNSLQKQQEQEQQKEKERNKHLEQVNNKLKNRSRLLGFALVVAVGTTIYAFKQATIANLGEQAAQARLASVKNPLDGLVKIIKVTGANENILHNVLDSVLSTLLDLLKTPVENNVFTGHKRIVTSVAFSPDGRYIASSSEDNTVRLWDVEGNPVSKPLRGHTDYVNSVAFSPKGDYIVTGSSDKTLRLWDLKGNSIHEFKGHQGIIRSVAFSPDGQFIVSGGDDGLRLWDLKGNVIQAFSKVKGQVKSVAFSHDGQTIVIANGTLQFWNKEGNSIGKPIEAHVYGILSLAISPDGKYIVTGGMDGTVKLIDFEKKTIDKTFPENGLHINAVAFSPDSRFIALSTGSTLVLTNILGDRDSEQKLIQQYYFIGHKNNITSIAFSLVKPYYLVTGSWDKTVRLWDYKQLTEQLPSPEDAKALLTVACKRLSFHPALVEAKTVDSEAAEETCQKVWNSTENAQFLVAQGRKIAQQSNIQEALAKFKQALSLNPKLDIKPEAEIQRLVALAQSEKEENPTVGLVTPPSNQATYGQVRLSEFTLNNKGNVVSATPREKINVSTNYIYNCPECQPGSINQIIVGIAGENGAQACIYDGGIKGSGPSRFTLTAPEEPGTYYIRFRYAQAYGCKRGALGWWRVGNEPTDEANIGVIVVK